MVIFHAYGSTISRAESNWEEEVYFSPLIFREFLAIIWLTLDGWNAELNLEPASDFEPERHWLGNQCPNHQAITW